MSAKARPPQRTSKRPTRATTKSTRSSKPRTKKEPGSKGLRLQVILSRAGVASRRQAERMITGGEVSVNGKIVLELGTRADPASDHIKVRGRLIAKPRRHEYFMLNKPAGCVTTMADPEGRLCVGDIASSLGSRVYPVGRLDFNSSGLLLLTNDGELCERLTHPRYHVQKTYRVKVSGAPSESAVSTLRSGVKLDDGQTAPAKVKVDRRVAGKAWLELSIAEGRNRQIRRMLEAVGLRVEKLRRTSVGPVRLGRLATGDLRRLTADEVAALRKALSL